MKLVSLALLALCLSLTHAIQVKANGLENNYFAKRFLERAQTSEAEKPKSYAQTVKALVRAQVYDTLESAGVFDKIDANLREVLRPFVKASQELGNREYDRNQAALNYHLKNLGSDDVGLLRFIPKETRQAMAGITKAMADPISSLGDRFQNMTNNVLKEFPQTDATAAGITSESDKKLA
jgi:hypothetical protein